MVKHFRTLVGFTAAWCASIAVAFLVGCIFALFMGNKAGQLLNAAVYGNKDAVNVFLFVGGTSAMAAAVIAFLAAIFIAWPLYLASRRLRHVTLNLYVLAGFGMALVVSGVLLAFQHVIRDFPGSGLWFEYVAILIAGPVATLTFWIITKPGQVSHNQ